MRTVLELEGQHVHALHAMVIHALADLPRYRAEVLADEHAADLGRLECEDRMQFLVRLLEIQALACAHALWHAKRAMQAHHVIDA